MNALKNKFSTSIKLKSIEYYKIFFSVYTFYYTLIYNYLYLYIICYALINNIATL